MTLASPVELGWRSLAGGLLEEICGRQLATGGSVSVDKKSPLSARGGEGSAVGSCQPLERVPIHSSGFSPIGLVRQNAAAVTRRCNLH